MTRFNATAGFAISPPPYSHHEGASALRYQIEIHLRLVGAIINGLIVEFYRKTVDINRSNIFQERLTLDEGGCLTLADRPGLGVMPNYDFLERRRVS